MDEIKKEPGNKFDKGKLRFDLISMPALFGLSFIYSYGTIKYEDRNWEKGISWSRIFGAMMRHLLSFYIGEDKDPESGFDHMDHVSWGAFALSHYLKMDYRNFDDRPRDQHLISLIKENMEILNNHIKNSEK